jgi:hypothetical protein
MLSNLHYAFKALVVGTYEGLLTRRSHITSEGKQSFISPYNKGHELFIISKLHTQQQNIVLN